MTTTTHIHAARLPRPARQPPSHHQVCAVRYNIAPRARSVTRLCTLGIDPPFFLAPAAVTSFFVLGCGDALSQVAIDRRWDLPRTLRFATIGLLITGPSLHFWYGYLARVLPGTSTRTVLARVAADQLVFSPVFLSVFLSCVCSKSFFANVMTSQRACAAKTARWHWWSTSPFPSRATCLASCCKTGWCGFPCKAPISNWCPCTCKSSLTSAFTLLLRTRD